jgi:5'-nucleotidase
MRILLSNDDGVHAPGLRKLHAAVRDLGDVEIVAPSEEQSATGQAITLFDPIKVRTVRLGKDLNAYAVGGTPADSVKLAICKLLDPPPELVLSGINLGPNTGISVIYSGTVSAALEAAILGVPGMAISLTTFKEPHWETAARAAHDLVPRLIDPGLPGGTVLNVNVPNLPPEEVRGYAVTRMGPSRFEEIFHKRADPRGNLYYWLDGDMELIGEAEGTDIKAVEEGYISLTPIGLDMTRYDAMERLRALADDLP